MMEQILIGLSAVGAAILFFAILGALACPTPPTERLPSDPLTTEDNQPDGDVTDDEGWIPLDTSPIVGYASITQGGERVGSVGVRRLNLQPGWEAGQNGMRPYTKKARDEYARLIATTNARRRS